MPRSRSHGVTQAGWLPVGAEYSRTGRPLVSRMAAELRSISAVESARSWVPIKRPNSLWIQPPWLPISSPRSEKRRTHSCMVGLLARSMPPRSPGRSTSGPVVRWTE